jgi:hypothetical protein
VAIEPAADRSPSLRPYPSLRCNMLMSGLVPADLDALFGRFAGVVEVYLLAAGPTTPPVTSAEITMSETLVAKLHRKRGGYRQTLIWQQTLDPVEKICAIIEFGNSGLVTV